MSQFEQKQRDPFVTEAGAKQLFEFNYALLSDPEEIDFINNTQEADKNEQCKISQRAIGDRLKLLILQYSIGEPIESMIAPAHQMFAEFERHHIMFPDDDDKIILGDAVGYRYTMWLIGLAYLLGLHEYLPKIATWISHSPKDSTDPLVSSLFKRVGVNIPDAPELLHPKGYAPLYELLTQTQDKTKQQTLMQTYIRGFYKNIMNQTVWKGWDTNPSIYFGFWSFEAGMITHLLNLDDSSYRDMTFYPKDLVEYARNQQPAASPVSNRYTGRTLRVGDTCTSTGWYEALLLNNRREHFTQGQVVGGEPLSAHGQAIVWYELTPEAAKEYSHR